MSTLPPPDVHKLPEDVLEKKVYKIVEDLTEYLPIINDRNRLGFMLYKYVKGEGDTPETIVKTAKVRIEGISVEELAKKIEVEINKITAAK